MVPISALMVSQFIDSSTFSLFDNKKVFNCRYLDTIFSDHRLLLEYFEFKSSIFKDNKYNYLLVPAPLLAVKLHPQIGITPIEK